MTTNNDNNPIRSSESLNKLFESIKNYKFNPNIVANLSCYYNDRLIVWNDDDQCIYGCSLDDRYNIQSIQVANEYVYNTADINIMHIGLTNLGWSI
ncbi:hypothetical protein BLA29_012606 [Euroglyphus maynei]|uniref:Uncharacterized protein n=1 Tax=Euroglyphus maynei TaxID=6958 RepID=A0A1Y3BIH8_EURMA|nr:hypothetical protein BLA29_012606 [Euroglyphus maynei]